MRIDTLRAQNFRCFDEHEFQFDPYFNVLIGENGVGKSALLKAVRIAVASWFLGIRDRHAVGIRNDDVRMVGRAFDAGDFTFEEQWPVTVEACGTVSTDGTRQDESVLEWSRSLNGPNGKTTRKDAAPIRECAEAADRRVREGDNATLPVLAYYSTSRLCLEPRRTQRRKTTPDKKHLSRFVGYRDCIDKRLDTKALEAWMKRQSLIAWEEGSSSTLYRLVRTAITQMVEGATDLRYSPQREEVVVVFKNNEVYPLDYLSDGQRTTLTLVGDLATRMARLNPHLGESALDETPGVVLIDELDLHLHPTWQRHIVQDLRRTFPQVQFITTTHSPQIISEVEPSALMHLKRTPQGIRVHRSQQAYGLDSNWILESLMDTPERPPDAKAQIKRVENALHAGDLETARQQLEELRDLLHGDDPDVVRLEASIMNLRSLADEADPESRRTDGPY